MGTENGVHLRAVVAALIERKVAASLTDVEAALKRWRDGEIGSLDAHGVALRHAARCERLIERVSTAAESQPEGVFRDAYDAGILDHDEFLAFVHREPEDVRAAGTDADDTEPPGKRSVIEALLDRGSVLVHVDARKRDVAVPPRFRGDPKLVLRFGYGLRPAIVDLVVDDEGLSGTLTFGGMPYYCVLPWNAVYAAVVEGEHRGTVWAEDLPDVVLSPPPEELAQAPQAPPPTGKGRQRGHLRLVD